MKKIILALLISFTALSADYVIKEDGTLTLQTTQSTTPPPADTWVGAPLPTEAFNVLDYGLKGDGVTDDSAALNALAANTNVTNWYFPADKIFKLHQISVPSHVEAIHGAGTIRSYDNGNTNTAASIHGALLINFFGNPAFSGLIVDGLTFDAPDFTTAQNYGMLGLYQRGGASTNNIEIRNCIFKNSSNLNGIKAFSDTGINIIHNNLRIYNNEFIGITGFFAIELINQSDGDSYPGLHVNNNYIHGGGNGISFIKSQGSTSYIHDNSLDGISMGIETAACFGTQVYNNTLLNNKGQAISDGGNTWGGTDIKVKKVYIHHNHIECTSSGYVYFYGGTTSEFYENYVKGAVNIKLQVGYEAFGTKFGNIHNNTLVGETGYSIWNRVVEISGLTGVDMTDGITQDNDIYSSISDGSGIALGNISAGVYILNNNFYLINNAGYCITADKGTQTGDTCEKGWIGDTPTGRTGAGQN